MTALVLLTPVGMTALYFAYVTWNSRRSPRGARFAPDAARFEDAEVAELDAIWDLDSYEGARP